MTKNVIWLKNELNIEIEEYSRFEGLYTGGYADGLRAALDLTEQLDDVDNDVKLRKRLDMMQHQIDELQKEVLDLSKRGVLNEIKKETKDYLNS